MIVAMGNKVRIPLEIKSLSYCAPTTAPLMETVSMARVFAIKTIQRQTAQSLSIKSQVSPNYREMVYAINAFVLARR